VYFFKPNTIVLGGAKARMQEWCPFRTVLCGEGGLALVAHFHMGRRTLAKKREVVVVVVVVVSCIATATAEREENSD